MAKSVRWSFNLSVDGGPTKTLAGSFDADGVDMLSVTIAKNTVSDESVEVQPGDLSDVKLLYIKSSLHDDVSYKLSDGTTDSDSIVLDTDHVLNSSEIVKVIGTAPKIIKFQNSNTTTDANIEILVARSA
ncbi:MAG: hypothetical protein M1503_02930 [Thaumarchaeota archaeon]|nr:hypothetical protein [Nitrososphaerota archaeon]MCL5317206.1 hypothetical protein [Nitrososphaerota archaeon]